MPIFVERLFGYLTNSSIIFVDQDFEMLGTN